jgi:DNA-binding response OmpR family regulator
MSDHDNGKLVLVVDDSDSIRRVVADHLQSRGYKVIEASDGIQGLEKGVSSAVDAIVLDVVMPGIDGLRLCHLLREKGVTTPVIMLTEKSEIEDKVEGFSSGADDYLAKPFSPVELELRVGSLIRRSVEGKKPEGVVLERGELEIDLGGREARLFGKEIPLTPLEFDILKILASSPGRVYSRQDLLFLIWDSEYPGYKRNIDPHVTRLRNKIEQNPKRPKYILTVWGVGYKFNEDMSSVARSGDTTTGET